MAAAATTTTIAKRRDFLNTVHFYLRTSPLDESHFESRHYHCLKSDDISEFNASINVYSSLLHVMLIGQSQLIGRRRR